MDTPCQRSWMQAVKGAPLLSFYIYLPHHKTEFHIPGTTENWRPAGQVGTRRARRWSWQLWLWSCHGNVWTLAWLVRKATRKISEIIELSRLGPTLSNPGGDEVRQMKRDDHLLDWVSHFSAKYPSWVNLQKLHVFSKDLTKRWNGHVRQKWSHWDWQLPSVWEGRRKYEEMYQNFSKFGLLMKHNVISLNISNHKTKRQCHLRLKHVSAPATRM